MCGEERCTAHMAVLNGAGRGLVLEEHSGSKEQSGRREEREEWEEGGSRGCRKDLCFDRVCNLFINGQQWKDAYDDLEGHAVHR